MTYCKHLPSFSCLFYTDVENTDIWSLGITIIELAEGQPPYYGMRALSAMMLISCKPPPVLAQPAKWSREMADFLQRCLEKDPKVRADSADLQSHKWLVREMRDISTSEQCGDAAFSRGFPVLKQLVRDAMPAIKAKRGQDKNFSPSMFGNEEKALQDGDGFTSGLDGITVVDDIVDDDLNMSTMSDPREGGAEGKKDATLDMWHTEHFRPKVRKEKLFDESGRAAQPPASAAPVESPPPKPIKKYGTTKTDAASKPNESFIRIPARAPSAPSSSSVVKTKLVPPVASPVSMDGLTLASDASDSAKRDTPPPPPKPMLPDKMRETLRRSLSSELDQGSATPRSPDGSMKPEKPPRRLSLDPPVAVNSIDSPRIEEKLPLLARLHSLIEVIATRMKQLASTDAGRLWLAERGSMLHTKATSMLSNMTTSGFVLYQFCYDKAIPMLVIASMRVGVGVSLVRLEVTKRVGLLSPLHRRVVVAVLALLLAIVGLQFLFRRSLEGLASASVGASVSAPSAVKAVTNPVSGSMWRGQTTNVAIAPHLPDSEDEERYVMLLNGIRGAATQVILSTTSSIGRLGEQLGRLLALNREQSTSYHTRVLENIHGKVIANPHKSAAVGLVEWIWGLTGRLGSGRREL